MKHRKNEKFEATIAPGIHYEEKLEKDATDRDIEKGDYTKVTSLTLDETDPS